LRVLKPEDISRGDIVLLKELPEALASDISAMSAASGASLLTDYLAALAAACAT
jgi:hypothetical protein